MNQLYTNRQLSIMDQALVLLHEGGITRLTMKNLAQKLNITEGAIYRHFLSKEEILIAITDHYRKDSMKILKSIQDFKVPNKEKIQRFFMSRCDLFENKKEMVLIVLSTDLAKISESIQSNLESIIEDHQKFLHGLIRQAMQKHEIRADLDENSIFRMIFGSLRLLIHHWYLSDYSFALPQEAEKLWHDLDKVISCP